MRPITLILFAVIIAALLSGCGTGSFQPNHSSASSNGRATFTIHWPERSRLIPDASNSIKIEIKQGTVSVAQKVLPRPANGGTSTVTFDPLPVGNLTVSAAAYPQSDGTGTAQATAMTPLVIQSGQTTPFSLTMASTIDHLELMVPRPTLIIGASMQAGVAAKDASGAVVLLSPAKLQWTSSNPGVATVDSTGKVIGVAAGTVDIMVKDLESSKFVTTTLLVKIVSPIAFQPAVPYSLPNAAEIVTADFDGDGNIDVVVGSSTQLVIFYGRGDGTLEPFQVIQLWDGGIAPASAADMNGDGKPDIVCRTGSDKVLIFHNTGGRSFAPPIAVVVGGLQNGMAVGDFNRDGRQDFVILTGTPGSTASDTTIYLNNGNGNYSRGASYHNIWILLGIAAADLDGDGKLDLITTVTTDVIGTSGVAVSWGDGTGNFTGGPSFNTGTLNVVIPVIADFDGDGKRDILVDNYFDNSVSVIFNQGNRAFSAPSAYGANQYPLITAAADFDGDGLPDIVTANAGTSYTTVLRNQNGLFPHGVTFDSQGSDCRTLAVADLNKDGKPDIILGNGGSGNISVLINNTP